jgi:hypothetical protein
MTKKPVPDTAYAGKARIAFTAPDGRVERLWAHDIGSGMFRLDNSPFYAYSISNNDVVEAESDEDGRLVFRRTIRKGGHKTIRIIFMNFVTDSRSANAILQRVTDLGCTWEGMQPRLVSVDVPPTASFDAVVEYLSTFPNETLEWEYADPTYGELNPS